MKKLNIASVTVFGVLAAAGITLAVVSGRLAQEAEQIVIAQTGSALFAGGLAFFLVEMFRWARWLYSGN